MSCGINSHHFLSRCYNAFANRPNIILVSSWNRISMPLTVQVRQMKKRSRSRSRSRSSDSEKLVRLKPKSVTAQPKPRVTSHKQIFADGSETDYFNEVDESHDDFEELANTITTYGDRNTGLEANEKYWREMLSFQRFVRAKTLERKYFRPPKKPNILTWAAKEQMRFLHQTDPEEWTMETLAKTFPVGIESTKKIIKSRIRLRKLQDVLKHDLDVRTNWQTILSYLRKNKLDSDNIVKDFLENLHSISIIENALPLPDFVNTRKRKKIIGGNFSAIVKDELERQEDQTAKLMAKQEQLNTLLLKILFEIKDILIQEIELEQPSIKYNQNISTQDSQEGLKTLIKSRFQEIPERSKSEFKESNSLENVTSESKGHMKAPQKVSLLTQKNQQKLYSYRVDDCIYDENGEFLYRIS